MADRLKKGISSEAKSASSPSKDAAKMENAEVGNKSDNYHTAHPIFYRSKRGRNVSLIHNYNSGEQV